jgi:translation initiation factor 3 subunit I
LLKGHTRSITFLKYNKEGDLLFTCSKDLSPSVWRSENGERLGTYDGHTGAVWSVDITRDSKLLLTGSADQSAKLWDVQTGHELFTFKHQGVVRAVAWAEGEGAFATISDPFGQSVSASINIYEFARKKEEQKNDPIMKIIDKENPKTRITKILWMPLNLALLASYEDGKIRQIDPKTGTVLGEWKEHQSSISSMTFNHEKTLLITSSLDCTAKLWDVASMSVLKVYSGDVPFNAAAISPLREHIIAGGGQEAASVTTTAASAGKFETRFFHLVFETELGRVKGHFGPVNTLAFHPSGMSFASGGEDGYIRLHQLDEEYMKLGEEDDLDDPGLFDMLKNGTFESLEREEIEAAKKNEEKDKRGSVAPVPIRSAGFR